MADAIPYTTTRALARAALAVLNAADCAAHPGAAVEALRQPIIDFIGAHPSPGLAIEDLADPSRDDLSPEEAALLAEARVQYPPASRDVIAASARSAARAEKAASPDVWAVTEGVAAGGEQVFYPTRNGRKVGDPWINAKWAADYCEQQRRREALAASLAEGLTIG